MADKKEAEVIRTLVLGTNELLNWLLSYQSEVLEIDGPHRVDFIRSSVDVHKRTCTEM